MKKQAVEAAQTLAAAALVPAVDFDGIFDWDAPGRPGLAPFGRSGASLVEICAIGTAFGDAPDAAGSAPISVL
jgi:hypothetical protein